MLTALQTHHACAWLFSKGSCVKKRSNCELARQNSSFPAACTIPANLPFSTQSISGQFHRAKTQFCPPQGLPFCCADFLLQCQVRKLVLIRTNLCKKGKQICVLTAYLYNPETCLGRERMEQNWAQGQEPQSFQPVKLWPQVQILLRAFAQFFSRCNCLT